MNFSGFHKAIRNLNSKVESRDTVSIRRRSSYKLMKVCSSFQQTIYFNCLSFDNGLQ